MEVRWPSRILKYEQVKEGRCPLADLRAQKLLDGFRPTQAIGGTSASPVGRAKADLVRPGRFGSRKVGPLSGVHRSRRMIGICPVRVCVTPASPHHKWPVDGVGIQTRQSVGEESNHRSSSASKPYDEVLASLSYRPSGPEPPPPTPTPDPNPQSDPPPSPTQSTTESHPAQPQRPTVAHPSTADAS